MSAVLPIEEDPRYRVIDASEGQTQFAISFPFQQNEDITVARRIEDGVWQALSPTLYDVTGAGAVEGGMVTFHTGRASGEKILVLGDTILDRLGSIVNDGRFSSRLTDDELDRSRIIQQELARDVARGLKMDYGAGDGLTVVGGVADGRTLMRQGGRLVAGPDIVQLAADAQTARDQAAGFVNDIVAEKEVPKTATVAGMAFLAFPSGMNYIETFGALAANDGVPTLLARVSAKPTTHDFYIRSADRFLPNGTIDPGDGGYWEVASPILNPKMIGAQFNGTDDTAEIQKTFIAGSVLNRRVVLPPGTTYLSRARSIHDKACLLLPEGLQLQGSGHLTKISRLPSERGLNGVLMVNEGYDTQGGYDAAGNITLENFYVEDGDDSATRGLGDLIAFGHAENVVVRGVHSGNHDQHFVDICSCKSVRVEKNVCRQMLATGDSVVQIDSADSLGIWGLYLDDTPNVDIVVDGNNILHKGINGAVHFCHGANTEYKGIRIASNDIDAAYLANSNGVLLDPAANLVVSGLTITGNRVRTNHASARGINLFNNAGTFDGVDVSHNIVTGLARIGIYIGSNAGDADLSVKRWKKVISALNIVNIDATGSTSTAATAATFFGVEGVAEGNIFELTRSIAQETGVVVINMPRGFTFAGNNKVRGNFAAALGSGANAAVHVIKQSAAAATELVLAANDLYGGNVNHCILYGASANWDGTDKHKVSGNRFPTDPLTSHLREIFAVSDGTNGWHEVNLSSIAMPTGGAVAIGAGQYYSDLPLGLKKTTNQQPSPAKITLQYAPFAADQMDTDCEAIQFAVTDAGTKDCVGTQVCDVNQAAGTFSIITGSAGVTAVIDNTTRKAVYRTAGYLKAFAGI